MSEKPCDQGHYHEVERQAWECLKRDLAAEKAENKRLHEEFDEFRSHHYGGGCGCDEMAPEEKP